MSDNYPLGAANDPSAPWNDKGISAMCRHCDIDELKEIARDSADERAYEWNKYKSSDEDSATPDEFYEECLEKILDEAGECRQCYFENYDDWREDV
jgi:hypothetical protein